MLISLHVKNIALIEESESFFGSKLNILTGETGAGKSILIGSINLALGAKADRDFIRKGAEYALVELVFQSGDKALEAKLSELGLPVEEDGTVIISRRILPERSISKINGETVTVRQVKELAELLIDIHGQHEHQSLLNKRKHLEILDAYAGEDLTLVKEQIAKLHRESKVLSERIASEDMDEDARKRELLLAEFELREIEDAGLKEKEDEQLEQRYRIIMNSRKLARSAAGCYRCTGYEEADGAGSQLGRALKELKTTVSYDDRMEILCGQLMEIDGLLNDFNRDMAEYMESLEFDEQEYAAVEERLNLINRLKGKYGNTIAAILEYGKGCQDKLNRLSDYEAYMAGLKQEYAALENKLQKACGKASAIRTKQAGKLAGILIKAMEELNFLSVQFEIAVGRKEITVSGYDDVEFMISTNPGEAIKPLGQVASGGELSRIMLAIKTVLADKDAVDTLIFDEIDAGISGKTAWKVSEKLNTLGEAHQVICITHLPQIAAMADKHFVIEKGTDGSSTVTGIRELGEEDSLKELARLLGSDELTEAALSNAKEMKNLAVRQKGK